MARKELNTKGKLDENISWVKTFGKKNMGHNWKNIIKDKKEVEEICTVVWEDSFFQKCSKHQHKDGNRKCLIHI